MRPWFVSFLVVALGLVLLAIPTRAGVERAAGTPLPESLTLFGAYEPATYTRGVVVTDSIVYASNGAGFEVIDARDPTSPSLLLSVAVPSGRNYDLLDIAGDRLLLWGSGDVYLFDISDPTSPTLHSVVQVSGYFRGVKAVEYRDDRLYAVECQLFRGCVWYFYIFDVSTPGAPQLVGEYQAPYDARWSGDLALDESGNYALIAAESGVSILDLGTLTPVPGGPAPLGPAQSIAVADGLVYLGGRMLLTHPLQIANIKMIPDARPIHELGHVGRLYLSGGMLVNEYRLAGRSEFRAFTLYTTTPYGTVQPRLDFVPAQRTWDNVMQGVAVEGSRLYLLETDGTFRIAIYELDRRRLPPPIHAPLHVGAGTRILPWPGLNPFGSGRDEHQ